MIRAGQGGIGQKVENHKEDVRCQNFRESFVGEDGDFVRTTKGLKNHWPKFICHYVVASMLK